MRARAGPGRRLVGAAEDSERTAPPDSDGLGDAVCGTPANDRGCMAAWGKARIPALSATAIIAAATSNRVGLGSLRHRGKPPESIRPARRPSSAR